MSNSQYLYELTLRDRAVDRRNVAATVSAELAAADKARRAADADLHLVEQTGFFSRLLREAA